VESKTPPLLHCIRDKWEAGGYPVVVQAKAIGELVPEKKPAKVTVIRKSRKPRTTRIQIRDTAESGTVIGEKQPKTTGPIITSTDVAPLPPHDDFVHDRYGWCYYSLAPNHAPVIYNLVTEPCYRRQGHGRRHLAEVVRRIRSAGYDGKIHVVADPSAIDRGPPRSALVRMYLAAGLTIIDDLGIETDDNNDEAETNPTPKKTEPDLDRFGPRMADAITAHVERLEVTRKAYVESHMDLGMRVVMYIETDKPLNRKAIAEAAQTAITARTAHVAEYKAMRETTDAGIRECKAAIRKEARAKKTQTTKKKEMQEISNLMQKAAKSKGNGKSNSGKVDSDD
jgi:ribosomal protein S18 acetylase RimI-like enzyme